MNKKTPVKRTRRATAQPRLTADLRKHIQECKKILAEQTKQLEKMMRINAGILAALSDGSASLQSASMPALQNGIQAPRPINAELAIAIFTSMTACDAVNIHVVPRHWLAVLARVSSKGSPYLLALSSLLKSGRIVKAGLGAVSLADPSAAAPDTAGLTQIDLLHRIVAVFSRQDAEILTNLITHWGERWAARQALAEVMQVSVESSSFRDRLTQLRKNKFVEFGANATVRTTLQWFWGKGKQ